MQHFFRTQKNKRSSQKLTKESVSDVFNIEKTLNTKIKTPLNLSDNFTLVMHCISDISGNLKLKVKMFQVGVHTKKVTHDPLSYEL